MPDEGTNSSGGTFVRRREHVIDHMTVSSDSCLVVRCNTGIYNHTALNDCGDIA